MAMIPFDIERVRENIRQATTEDLLDRATVYRNGMEPEALAIIDGELRGRGVTEAEIETHLKGRAPTLMIHADGMAIPCSSCSRPAIGRRWVWYRKWGILPLFPRPFYHCPQH